jgi:hypothetical protein
MVDNFTYLINCGMLPHISPINTYKGAISSYLLEVLCRGVQDRMYLLSSCIQDICWKNVFF